MTRTQTWRLFGLLTQNESLKTRGYSLSCSRDGGIVIDRSGHVRGIWGVDGDSYTWLTPGDSEPKFRTGDPQSALLYTLVALVSG